MASKRMISRRVAMSKKLSVTHFPAEALYYRGIPFLDDAGRLTADPEECRALLIPRGKFGKAIPIKRMENIINELFDVGLIGICECGTKRCMQYTNFEDFQILKTDRKPQIDCKEPAGFHWKTMEDNGGLCLREVSIGLNNNNAHSTDYTKDFETFWTHYPRKIAKVKAFKCYQKLLKEGVAPADLLLSAKNYAAAVTADKTEEKFIKHPSTFLGPDKHFEDYTVELEEPKTLEQLKREGKVKKEGGRWVKA